MSRWLANELWLIGVGMALTLVQIVLPTTAPTPAGPPPMGQGAGALGRPSSADGLAIYDEHCVRCHGPLGAGDGDLADRLARPPASLADPVTVRQRSPRSAFDIVTEGRLDAGMPPWSQSLSEAERWAAVYGAWSFYYTPDRLVRGRAAWDANCAACHGANGDGVPAARLTDPAWMAERSQADLFAALPEAHAALKSLPDEVRWSALDYARSFTFEAPPTTNLAAGGRVSGVVQNGTAGQHPVAGSVVRLLPMGALALSPAVTATVASDGMFAFEDLIIGPDARYGLAAAHAGVDVILPEALALSADSPNREGVAIQVYETAPDVPLTVKSAHLVLSPDPEAGLLRIAEVWVVANRSDRARIAGPNADVLRLALPPGHLDLSLEDARMRAVDQLDGDVLVDRVPVPPGERELVLSYALPYSGTTAKLERTIPLAADAFRILAVGDGVGVVSPELAEQRTTDIQGRPVREAVGRDLAAGTVVATELTGLPASSGVAAQQASAVAPRRVDQPALSILALVLGGLALAVALLYPDVVARQQSGVGQDRLAERRSRLVEQIADLDRRHRAGTIGDAEHASRRTELMQQAIAVSREQTAREGTA